MPIYEYVCQHCGLKFELYRGFWQSDEEIECPSCGWHAATRQFSSFNATSESCNIG